MYLTQQQPSHDYQPYHPSHNSYRTSFTTNQSIAPLGYRQKGSSESIHLSPSVHSLKLKQKKSVSNSADSLDTCESDEALGVSSESSISKPKYQDENQSKNKLKVELCKNFIARGYCPYESRCRFAHGLSQLRAKAPHYSDLYRTRLCKVFFEKGECRFGQRCNFRHQKQEDSSSKPTEARIRQLRLVLRSQMPGLYSELVGRKRQGSRLMEILSERKGSQQNQTS